ncbi:MAG: YitT family protein [Firmicutes bacterium]|nr:YitT family protein [Bacillota bacterium]MCL2255909.1 YitT family protein [Bacillota bacterium]
MINDNNIEENDVATDNEIDAPNETKVSESSEIKLDEDNIVMSPSATTATQTGTKISRFLDNAMSKNWGIYSIIVLVAVLRAFTVHLFIVPFNFAPGGVTGIAVMIEYGTGINWAVWLMAINIPLLIMCFFLVGKKFAFRTALLTFVTLGISALLEFADSNTSHVIGIYVPGGSIDFSVLMPSYDMVMFAPILGGVLTAIFVVLLLRIGASGGGVDIIGVTVNKYYPRIGFAVFIMGFDIIVITISFFVYGNDPSATRSGMDSVLLAFAMVFTTGLAINFFLRGFKSAIKFEIITTDPEALSKVIMKKLNRGVTKISATGMYRHEDKGLLICIVRKNEIIKVKNILKDYPNTFAYVTPTSEVLGQGFFAGV